MKKKLLSGLLVAAMAMSLFAGCGGGGDDSSKNNSAGGTQGGAAADGEDAGISKEIDMDEDPYTVAIQVVTLPGTDFSAYEADLEAKLNEITLPAINCNVDVQFVWISEVANTTSMAVAGNEKVDLLHVATVSPLSSMVGSDMLHDMNEDNLLQNRGPKLVELFSDRLETGNVNGQQLAVPAKTFDATAKGIAYNKDMLDEAGATLGEKITMDDLEAALIKVHEKFPDVYPYYSGTGELNYLFWLAAYETFGTESSYGVILDAATDPTIVNLYETDMFKDYCVRMQKWNEMGLQPGDPTDTSSAQDYFNAGKLFSAVVSVNPEQEVMWRQSGLNVEYATLVDPVVNNTAITEYMWGIASNCERPDKAMDLLNFIYSNADVANLLQYGIEGTNYDFSEGSEKVIVANGTYDPMFYYAGNSADMLIKAPAGEDYIDQLQAMQDAATISPICGYMFSDADFQTEASVINSTILQYLPRLQCGMCGSEEETLALIDEFNSALAAAGINDVIAANQEQLDAYLAAQ